MTTPLRVAVVGVGRLGRHHARIYSELPDVKLVGVAELKPEEALAVAREWGTRPFASHLELPPVDAVSIAVPTRDHFEVARHFLDRGIATLLEKPMASTVEEAETLVALALERHAPLQVGHVERFNPAVIAIGRMRIQPRFIEVHRLSPFPFRSTDIGVVLDVMIHDIDIVLHLVQAPLKRVEALGVSVLSAHEDIANARLLFANGCLANITASRVSARTERKIRVFSEDCYVSLDYEKKHGVVYRKSSKLREGGIRPEAIDPDFVGDPREYLLTNLLDVTELDLTDHEPLRAELEAFVACARSGGEPVVSGAHGLRAMVAAEAILRAMEEFARENWGDVSSSPFDWGTSPFRLLRSARTALAAAALAPGPPIRSRTRARSATISARRSGRVRMSTTSRAPLSIGSREKRYSGTILAPATTFASPIDGVRRRSGAMTRASEETR